MGETFTPVPLPYPASEREQREQQGHLHLLRDVAFVHPTSLCFRSDPRIIIRPTPDSLIFCFVLHGTDVSPTDPLWQVQPLSATKHTLQCQTHQCAA